MAKFCLEVSNQRNNSLPGAQTSCVELTNCGL